MSNHDAKRVETAIAETKRFTASQRDARVLAAELTRLQTFERPQDFPCIVCLCGSTRFMDAFHEMGWQLTLDGYIVLTVGVCKHAKDHGGEALGQDVADKLDELHFRKIDLADWVLILNVDGYIGESTRKELEYAKSHGKRVTFLEPADPGGDP
jgi:hypothetical protein